MHTSFFLQTLALVFGLTLWCHLVGRRLIPLLPWRQRPAAGEHFAVLFGLAALTLAVVPWGWWGSGFRGPGGAVLLCATAAAALWMEPDRAGALRGAARQGALTLAVSLPFTFQILRFGAYDVFNDPYTYLVQSQWLQDHGLSQTVSPLTNERGVLAQVAFSQETGTRVAAQFVVAFLQGACGLPWAHQAYPLAICLALGAGGSAVAGSLVLARRVRRWLPVLVALLTGLALNGFTFGALRGFLPQTFGLALGLGVLTLGGHALARRQPARGLAVVVGVLLAAATFAYSDLLPLLGASLGLAGLAALRSRPRVAWHFALWLGLTTGLLLNVELLRAARAPLLPAEAIAGPAIPWSLGQFFRHAFGGEAAFKDGSFVFGGGEWISWLFVLGAAGAALLAATSRRLRPAAAPLWAYVVVSALLFAHDHWHFASPSPLGPGEPSNQFRLANWLALPLAALAALGAGRLWHALRGRTPQWTRAQKILLLLLLVPTGLGLTEAWRLADERTEMVRRELAFAVGPFAGLLEFREQVLAQLPRDQTVLLDLPKKLVKSRQLLAYALLDRPVAVDWIDDQYARQQIPEIQQQADRSKAAWRITPDGEPFRLVSAPTLWIEPGAVAGAYVPEKAAGSWLVWAKQEVAFPFRLARGAGAPPSALWLSFRLVTPVADLPLTLLVTEPAGREIWRETMPAAGAHNRWDDPPAFVRRIPLGSSAPPELTVKLLTTATPQRLHVDDPREVTFYVRDLVLDAAPPKP